MSTLSDRDKINVLISLYKGYGMGDAVQMSSVLRHVVKYRPNWKIDFQAEEGRHCVGRGIVDNTFAYGQPYPSEHYDSEVQILLHDSWANWDDRPNTRVTSCLHERFGIDWDESLGRYQIKVREESKKSVLTVIPFLSPIVGFHFEGDSAHWRKNLTLEQAERIRDSIWKLKVTPLLLDWRGTSKLININSTGHCQWSKRWGGDAEMNCAVISWCKAFIGIDSGPGKCASATDTPSLIIWTDHHPSAFHDPAPNTTHLVPYNYHSKHPVLNDPGVVKWFESHYNIIQYKDDPCEEVNKWLKEVLK